MNRDETRLLNRLHRIEGQVRGISQMIQNDRYCIDVLTQLRAARAALRRVETELLKVHVAECARTAITGRNARERLEKAEELIRLLERSA
jgi:DNA-binding FrmR family transcriptional regulator